MSERARMLGERVEYRQKMQGVAVRCDALKKQLRELCSPTLAALELDENAILDTAAALHSELNSLRALHKQVAVLNSELGD